MQECTADRDATLLAVAYADVSVTTDNAIDVSLMNDRCPDLRAFEKHRVSIIRKALCRLREFVDCYCVLFDFGLVSPAGISGFMIDLEDVDTQITAATVCEELGLGDICSSELAAIAFRSQ